MALAILIVCIVAPAGLADPPQAPWRSDRIIIQPKAGHDRLALGNLHNRLGMRVRKTYPAMADLQVLELPAGAGVEETLRVFRASGLVAFAEPDFRVQATLVTPNDPRFTDGTLWNLSNPAGTGDLDAPEGWGITNNASNVVVAVIDSGMRVTHEDLAANMWRNPREIAGDGIDNDGNGLVDDIYGINAIGTPNNTNVLDDLGHGTHVAGIIGAVGNNGIGSVGVAWKVQIMACKFMDSTGNGYISDAVECFDYARLNGAKVINASFGSTSYSSALDSAINACRTAGIIVVAAAGNDGANNDALPYYPANLGIVYGRDNVVAVAATDRYDQLAYFSNYGSNNVHLAAPGYGIYSTYNFSDNSYTYLSGTSMAAPHVAGALALLRARFPIETPAQLIRRMTDAADVLPGLMGRCRSNGRLNLHRALANYQILTNAYNWITVTNAAGLTLPNDGVSAALPLPFAFNFYGRNYSQLYVGANGLLGFATPGLTNAANTDLSGTNSPLAVICPFWDDLNPASSGTATFGTNGSAPNRRIVVSWNSVPRASSSSTKLTFQAVLDESTQRILFQYLEAQPNRTLTGGGARSATIGLRNHDGTKVVRYTVNGTPFILANKTAFAFVPLAEDGLEISPGTNLVATGNAGGPFAPQAMDYALTNLGNTILNWSAVPSENWISLSATNGTLAVGQGGSLTVALNPAANGLPAGSHVATVNFYLAGKSEPVAARAVSLAIFGTNSALAVTPTSDWGASGFTGGPFTPGANLYTLLNGGDAATAWSAIATQSWLTVSPSNGTLAPGASVAVNVLLNTNANTLSTGAYSGVIEFLNLTSGQGSTSRTATLQVAPRPGILAVAPAAGFEAAGIAAGTFAPPSMVYALTNTGVGPFDWMALASQPWVQLSPTNGTLAPGQVAEVTALLAPVTQTFTAGTYYATLGFVNLTSSAGNSTRPVTLQVYPAPGVLLVLPGTNSLIITGYAGGPITFTNHTFSLTNAGGSNLVWTAAVNNDWLALSAPDGALAPGATTNLVVTLSSNAFTLPAGQYTNALLIEKVNGSNSMHEIEVVLDLAIPPPTNAALAVLPGPDFHAEGLVGGPFSPTGMVFTLINTGDLAAAWEIVGAAPWLELSATNGTLPPGETNEIMLAFSTNALALTVGDYSASLEFHNLTTTNTSATRTVRLAVYPLPGVLEVQIETNRLSITGFAGGPIAFTNLTVVLTNTGGSNLAWITTATQDWLEIVPANGGLVPSSSTNLVIGLGPNAFALPVGQYTNLLTITGPGGSHAIAFSLELVLPPATNAALIVLPDTDFLVSGLVGGLFSPTGMVFTLINTGDLATAWEIIGAEPWLDLATTNGTLLPGETNEVGILINTNAQALAIGQYVANLEFHNLTTGASNTIRRIVLDDFPQPGRLQVLADTNLFLLDGYVGGPLLLTNQVIALTNAGGSNVQWRAELSADWLVVGPTNGALAAGESALLTLMPATNVWLLEAGFYTNVLAIRSLETEPALETTFVLDLRPLPTLSATAIRESSRIQFSWTGVPNSPCFLEYSLNLTNWFPYTTNTFDADGALQISEDGMQTMKFFRVRLP